MKKQISPILLFVFLVGCQTGPKAPPHETRPPVPDATAGSPSTPATSTHDFDPPSPGEGPTPVPVVTQRPRLAVILGPGGLRAYAHAGVLQELAKAKIPVYWVGGLEMGALPAALFALKGQPFEPEWQMMKLKQDDLVRKGLLGGTGLQKAETLEAPLKVMFGNAKAEDAKLPMICPSYSIGKRQTYLMSRGPFSQMLMYCLPSIALHEPYQGNGANVLALTQMAQSARQKGAQLIVYVDVLGDAVPENENGFLWGIFQQNLEQQSKQVASEVLRVNGLSGLRAFEKRREMLQKGQEAGKRLVQTLQTRYGF